MSGTVTAGCESRMPIDGKLVHGGAGAFVNINPATEEPRAEVADPPTRDVHTAIGAARRGFDETDWSTDRAFRRRCLPQLPDAIEAEREDLREELIREVGCPRSLTYGPQLDAPLSDALRYPAVVTAADHLIGEELTLSPEVDLISFTESTVVGKRQRDRVREYIYGADTAFGGYENGGVGWRNGTVGFDQCTEVKSVAFPAT